MLFLGPAKRRAHYLAIPAPVFRAISELDFHAQFNPNVVTTALRREIYKIWAPPWKSLPLT
jgi:hypothetical protein